MSWAFEIPIELNVDEATLCSRIASPSELLQQDGCCALTLLPAPESSTDQLFPNHGCERRGEVDPTAWEIGEAPNFREVRLFKIREAFIFPSFGVVVTKSGQALLNAMAEAAWKTPDLKMLPGAVCRDGGTVLKIPRHTKKLDKVIVTLPYGATVNYGHFVCDCLPAAILLQKQFDCQGYTFLTPNLRPWQKRHFELLGVEPRETADDIVEVEEILYTNAMDHFLQHPNLNYRDVRNRQLTNHVDPQRVHLKNIYLSRGEDRSRVLLSEPRLLANLVERGFEIVDPGLMTIDEQIALFRNAEVIVGPTGAAFANVLYCGPGTRVIEIQPIAMQSFWVQSICMIVGTRSLIYSCNVVHGESPTQMVFDMDVDMFLETLASFVARK